MKKNGREVTTIRKVMVWVKKRPDIEMARRRLQGSEGLRARLRDAKITNGTQAQEATRPTWPASR